MLKKKKNKRSCIDTIFFILIIFYIIAMIFTCNTVFNNDNNMYLIKSVLNDFIIKDNSKYEILLYSFKFIIRDTLLLFSILLLSYSGILKIIISVIPFILSMQNAAIYSASLLNYDYSMFNMLFFYSIKDTAVALLIILCASAVLTDIILKKQNKQPILKVFSSYIIVLCIIYLIDIITKLFVI